MGFATYSTNQRLVFNQNVAGQAGHAVKVLTIGNTDHEKKDSLRRVQR